VLSKINNQWTFRNKIAGFDYSSKYFEIMNNLNVFVSHEYKGFIDELDNKLTKTKPFITYIQKVKCEFVKFNNTIYYANKEGILS
jgi:hypothetical protein